MIEPIYPAHHAEKFPIKREPPYSCRRAPRRPALQHFLRHLQLKTRNRICLPGNYYPPKASLMRRKRDQLPPLRSIGPTDFDITKENYMLILTRKVGESIVINDDIKVTILGVKGMQVRIGIDAPKDVQVHREEIFKRIQAGSPAPEKHDDQH